MNTGLHFTTNRGATMIKILLEDYLKDQTETRLRILVSNINPEFKLTKKNSAELIQMIQDWSSDKSPKRLKIIKNWLGNTITPNSSVKKVKAKLASNSNTVDDEYITIQDEMKALHKQIIDAKGDKMILESLQPIYRQLDERLQIAMRIRDKRISESIDPVSIEKDMILKLFGNPEDKTTHAYKILNGEAYDFKIQMVYDPVVMIGKLFRHNNKEPYEYAAGLIDARNRVWRVTKGQTLASYDQGTRGI